MLQINFQTSTVELDGVTYTLREHTAAQADTFQRLLNAVMSAEHREAGKTPEQALGELLAFLLHPQNGAETPSASDLAANVSTRMALAIVDEQSRLNSYEEILGNLLRRGTPAAKAAVSQTT